MAVETFSGAQTKEAFQEMVMLPEVFWALPVEIRALNLPIIREALLPNTMQQAFWAMERVDR